MKKILIVPLLATLLLGCSAAPQTHQQEAIRIGWISALSGPVTKYGADKAAQIAVDEINAAGGIKGKKLELIMEDGKCDPKTAAAAAQKLIMVDQVNIILGGHCSPETIAAAPIAQQNHVILLASISSSPDITTLGDYIFRTTALATAQAPIMAKAMIDTFHATRLAIIYEETSYAQPIANAVRDAFVQHNGSVVAMESFVPGEKDFRAQLSKIKASHPDVVYISPQDNDKAVLILKQMQELGIKARIFGNEVVGSQPTITALGEEAEGIISAAPAWDTTENKPHAFIETYTERYGVEPPYGILTAESYDAVHIIADAIDRYGENDENIKTYLEHLQNYSGASGVFSLDEHGDALRTYQLMRVTHGINVPY